MDVRSGGATTEPRSGWLGRDVAAGLFLIALAGLGLAGSWHLAHGQLSGGSSGLMPRATALLLGLCGIVLVAQGLLRRGQPFEPASPRALALVIGAIVLFGATIRPLGLPVAGFVCVVMAALADPASRLRQVVPFAAALTVACVLLFRFVLRQPIPLAPFLLGY